MLCLSIVLWLRCLGKSAPNNGRARRIGCSTVAKFAPRLRARAIWKSLLEVEVAKICNTPARESDLEVKIVKN